MKIGSIERRGVEEILSDLLPQDGKQVLWINLEEKGKINERWSKKFGQRVGWIGSGSLDKVVLGGEEIYDLVTGLRFGEKQDMGGFDRLLEQVYKILKKGGCWIFLISNKKEIWPSVYAWKGMERLNETPIGLWKNKRVVVCRKINEN